MGKSRQNKSSRSISFRLVGNCFNLATKSLYSFARWQNELVTSFG